jgi:hypothetical protein
MLKTKWRWGTFFKTFPHTHLPNSTTRFWWQEGVYVVKILDKPGSIPEVFFGCFPKLHDDTSAFK